MSCLGRYHPATITANSVIGLSLLYILAQVFCRFRPSHKSPTNHPKSGIEPRSDQNHHRGLYSVVHAVRCVSATSAEKDTEIPPIMPIPIPSWLSSIVDIQSERCKTTPRSTPAVHVHDGRAETTAGPRLLNRSAISSPRAEPRCHDSLTFLLSPSPSGGSVGFRCVPLYPAYTIPENTAPTPPVNMKTVSASMIGKPVAIMRSDTRAIVMKTDASIPEAHITIPPRIPGPGS